MPRSRILFLWGAGPLGGRGGGHGYQEAGSGRPESGETARFLSRVSSAWFAGAPEPGTLPFIPLTEGCHRAWCVVF
jgi:hypothetical protein